MIREHGRVVVGFDGSPAACAAARAAVVEAHAHGGEVRLVAAVPRRLPGSRRGGGRRARVDAVRRAADVLWAGLHADHVETGLWLDVHVGRPAAVLLDAARDADLLLLGRRAGPAGRRVLRGSTAARCARRATCPVVVVPDGGVAGPAAARTPTASGAVPSAAA